MQIAILAVPYDNARHRSGVGLGPARLLDAGLARDLRREGHFVREEIVELTDSRARDELSHVVALQRALKLRVAHALARDEFPIVLAGNCHSAVGTLAARPQDTAVVWFDAHGDFNTPETTITGMLDGMALAMCTGRCHREAIGEALPGFQPVRESQVLLAGARDLDRLEAAALANSAVQRLSIEQIPALPLHLRAFGSRPGVYLHLDLDVLDASLARANRYAPPGGLTPAALTCAIDVVATSGRLFAMAVTAYDPAYDGNGRAAQTAMAAVKMAVPRDTAPE